MTPRMMARRPLYAFVLALILWAPSAKGFLHDNLDLTTTAVRFLIALAASWIGITILALVVAGYGKTAAPAEAQMEFGVWSQGVCNA